MQAGENSFTAARTLIVVTRIHSALFAVKYNFMTL